MLLIGMLLAGQSGADTNVALDNILVSKTNGVTNLQIWPACRMRYLDHAPVGAGLELRIKVETDGDCAELLESVDNEVYLPLGRRLGGVSKIVFDTLDNGDTFITLLFTSPQQFDVRQDRIGWIEIYVDTNVDTRTLPAAVPPPLRAEPQVAGTSSALPRTVTPRPTTRPTRTPTRRQVPPSATGEFVVQLGVFESADLAVAELLKTGTPHFAYTTDFTINGREWHGLQIGFFDSEATAEAVLTELRATFPDSWVRYVNPDEAERARNRGELRASSKGQVPAVRVTRADPGDPNAMAARAANGRQALLDRRYEDAIEHYTYVLEHPDHDYRATAREYIGVAFERSGQPANAIAEYQAYLSEFQDEEGTARVESRLTSLMTASAVTATEPLQVRSADPGSWEVYGGVSQYYWRNEQQLVHDGNTLVSSSGILALADVTASKRGTRFDILARANGAYQFNLVEYDDTGDVGWLSNAYVDVIDNQLGIRGTAGRQMRRSEGAIDRFDGVAVSYQWKPDLSFSMSTGFPVDSPRYISGSERFFYAFGAQLDDLWGKVSVNAYTHQQTVDGISDRQAVGAEVTYREGPLSLVGLVDYDASYNVLNTLLVNGHWQLDNGWRLTGTARFGAQPYLTTRNALAGQTARSIDELLETYSEGQVRTLARDRTAQATTISAGLALPLSNRIELAVDVTLRHSDETVASGGVAAIPDTGNQMFYNATLIGSSLMKQGDLNMLTLRHDSTLTYDTSTLTIDSRIPVGEGLRINPRLSLVQRTHNATDTEQTVVQPSIRLMYRWRSLLVDVEAGGRWSSRDLPLTEIDLFTVDGTEELTGGFINIGYRWEF